MKQIVTSLPHLCFKKASYLWRFIWHLLAQHQLQQPIQNFCKHQKTVVMDANEQCSLPLIMKAQISFENIQTLSLLTVDLSTPWFNSAHDIIASPSSLRTLSLHQCKGFDSDSFTSFFKQQCMNVNNLSLSLVSDDALVHFVHKVGKCAGLQCVSFYSTANIPEAHLPLLQLAPNMKRFVLNQALIKCDGVSTASQKKRQHFLICFCFLQLYRRQGRKSYVSVCRSNLCFCLCKKPVHWPACCIPKWPLLACKKHTVSV